MTRGRFRFEMTSRAHIDAIWEARRMGTPTASIATTLNLTPDTVRRHLHEFGGIDPGRWKNPDRLLTFEERQRIKELIHTHASIREIARTLGRSPSTISRELARGGARSARFAKAYSPTQAHRRAYEHRRRPKPLKIPSHPELHALVQDGLHRKLSPEQISHRLRKDYPERHDLRVSPETIYKTIYLQARGGLKRELAALTRTGRTIRHPQRTPTSRRGHLTGMISIWERPKEALERTIPGHWEGDLLVGKHGKSAIATIVERHSNYLILGWLDPTLGRVQATEQALIRKLSTLPDTLRRTLTWDQGKEMATHQHIATTTGISIYFADPHSPWQRASNENTNGLLRQYFPKGTDLSHYTQTDLDHIANEMNHRPRKRLDWNTPYEVLSTHLLQ